MMQILRIVMLGLLCLPQLALASPVAVTVQLKWKHQFQFAGFYMALEKGYYRDAGLDVTLLEGGPERPPVTDFVIQHPHAYGVTSTGALIERARGKPVVALGAVFQHSPLVILLRQDSAIASWSDLKGKRIMLQSGYLNADILAALSNSGISEQDFIRQPISYNVHDLIDGYTDAFAAYITDQPHQMALLGVPCRILRPVEKGVDFYGDIIITSDHEVQQHPEQAQALMAATVQGWRYALEHSDEAVDLILARYNTQHLSREQLQFEAAESEKLIMPNVVDIGYMNDARWERIAQRYVDQDLLPQHYSLHGFLYHPDSPLIFKLKRNGWWIALLLLVLLAGVTGIYILSLRQSVKVRTQELEEEKKALAAAEAFENEQRTILESIIADDVPLTSLLEIIVHAIQRQKPDMLASILLLSDDGRYLYHGAAPGLPESYCKALDGAPIGPDAGSCGTAAYRNEQVIVSDIRHDPLWLNYKELALAHGLAACWSHPIRTGDGQVLGTFAMYYHSPCLPGEKEIELIRQAAALAANAIQYQKNTREIKRQAGILESTSDFVLMINHNGQVLYINAAGRKLVGLPEDSSIERLNMADFHSPEENIRLMQDILPQVSRRGSYQCDYVWRHQDGHEIPTSAVFIAHAGDSKGREAPRYSVIARDLTIEREIQANLEHSQRLESLGVLAGGIAHDFNNILTAIMGNAALAELKVVKDPIEARTHLSHIVSSSEKAAILCKQMLAYSGKGTFVIKRVDLSAMVEEISRLLEVSIEKSVSIQYRLSSKLPPIEGDIAQLQQVIMNLVINASDAIGEHHGVINIHTGVMHCDAPYLADSCLNDALPAGHYVFLEVSDTGCGMDKATRKRIFEPFFTTKFSGHGLGMSAVLGIVRAHQGCIHLYSEVGRGTTFKVLLPVAKDVTSAMDDEPAASPVSQPVHPGGVVLVVDDDDSIRQTAGMILRQAGFEVLEAADGVEGVEVYRRHQTQIVAVLMDMTMPNMDGKSCFRELKRINPEVKVVLSSGYNESESISVFAGHSLAGFIQKPYHPARLQEAMVAVVQGGRSFTAAAFPGEPNSLFPGES